MSNPPPFVERNQYSERGFAHWEPVPASYGAEIKVYESSAAEGPHLWVNVAAECHLSGPVREVAGIPHGVAPGSSSAHLSMERARDLRDKLDAAITHSERRFGVNEDGR